MAAGYSLRCVNISCACIDPDISTAMVFLSVMLGNVAPHLDDWTETRAFAGLETQTPDGIREPMSVQSVAESLGIPFETVRRRVRRLRDLGLLASSTKGLVVAPGAMARPGLKRLVLEASAANEDLVDDALRLGLMDPPDPIDEDVRRQSARLSAR